MKKLLSLVLIMMLMCSICLCGCGARQGNVQGNAIINNCNIKINNLYVGSMNGISNLVLVNIHFENNDDKAHSLCGMKGACQLEVYHDGVKVGMDTVGGDCWKEILPGNSLDITIRSTYSYGKSGTYLVVVSTTLGKKITEKQFMIP